MMKKITAFIMGLVLLAAPVLTLVSANGGGSFGNGAASPKVSQGFGVNAENTAGIAIGGTGQDQGSNLINIVKSFINWVLGLLGLITFVLLLWGGFNMVTAAGDDKKFGIGQTILKHAAIGLGFIALSWFMVTIIFWVIGTVGANTSTTGA